MDTDSIRTATGTSHVKRGISEMLEGGVILDIVNTDQADISEDASAVAGMALERVPTDTVATIEAMKMEAAITAPVVGASPDDGGVLVIDPAVAG